MKKPIAVSMIVALGMAMVLASGAVAQGRIFGPQIGAQGRGFVVPRRGFQRRGFNIPSRGFVVPGRGFGPQLNPRGSGFGPQLDAR